ncbi:unnamed protein product [Symbiodinium natans]|uniref:Uncharacterized protein n=1 Tax=Symbiodinium natans TaxID=878477 RepID=A0A812IK28_9DINO|nr:unnamed protein product [Symbiodinium natans]
MPQQIEAWSRHVCTRITDGGKKKIWIPSAGMAPSSRRCCPLPHSSVASPGVAAQLRNLMEADQLGFVHVNVMIPVHHVTQQDREDPLARRFSMPPLNADVKTKAFDALLRNCGANAKQVPSETLECVLTTNRCSLIRQ